jgi:transcriptional regulator with XRE-family HTH domain
MGLGHSNAPGGSNSQRRPTELDVRIGRLIRERRLLLNLTQEKLARLLGITQHQLLKYETGDNRIAASRLVECARALEVPVTWFYQSSGHQASPTTASNEDLAKDEHGLLDAYRALPAPARAQLISIAHVLRGEQKQKKRKKPRT